MRRVARVAAALVVAVVVLAGAAATARGEGDRESRARAHYEVGLGMYHLGNYRDAIREFSAGYELSPRPLFLINLGQAYRKLGELDKAGEMFRRYLAVTPPEAPDRAQVRELLAAVDKERGSAPPPTSEREPPRPPLTSPAVTSPAAAAVVSAPPPPKARSGIRRYWWAIPVAAVGTGLVLGLTLYFTLPPSQVACTSATIGCVDLRH